VISSALQLLLAINPFAKTPQFDLDAVAKRKLWTPDETLKEVAIHCCNEKVKR
jgi:hypothetical protein